MTQRAGSQTDCVQPHDWLEPACKIPSWLPPLMRVQFTVRGDYCNVLLQSTTPDQFEREFEARESPPQPDPLLERDRLIDHLQGELKRMRYFTRFLWKT